MTGNIKVLRIIARLNIGGPAVQAILLTNALNSGGFESMLVSGMVDRGEAEMTFLLKEYGVRPVFIRRFARPINPLNDVISFFAIYRLIKGYRPHIVHTHTSKAGFIGRIAAFTAGVPVKVHTFHGHTFSGYFGALKSRIFLGLERFLSRLTDVVIAISPLQHNDLVKTYKVVDSGKCRVVPLGLPLDGYLSIDPARKTKEGIGFGDDDIVIGTVGRMTGIKNHKLFLEIARLFLDSYGGNDVKFVIVGDGELKEELIAYRDRLALADKVRVFGWQEDMVRFYSAFDIFLLTSKNEGTPVAMIEAMASSVPILSTGVGGVPDVLAGSRGGYMVKGSDPAAFVDKLKAMVSDKALRNSMGKDARNAVRETFHKNRLVNDIKGLYTELLKEKGANR
ncbi:MAG: glycosyltransferase family 4 protein [Candidatus Omnitrophota bacterium]